MKQKLLLAAFALLALQAFSQKNYWKQISRDEASTLNKGKALFDGGFQPTAYKLFTVDEAGLTALIKQAPLENRNIESAPTVTIMLPVANGNLERFSIVEAPVMMPKLQAKYPNIRSYAGQGIDDPKKTIRMDISPIGLHATINVTDGKTTYINPIYNGSKLYVLNERNDNDKSPSPFVCNVDGMVIKSPETTANKTTFTGNADDGKLRTYRLALCVTGLWSRAIMTGTETTTQDSINTVMSNITAYLVRVNEVYERDLGIRLLFVDNEDTLIFLNPATDPFGGNLNSQCQTTCDKRIGDANYDVGHVIDKAGSNGNAGCINCVCKTGSKGSGMTQYSSVSTATLVDYFIIDYWTHEMGHQVGANHSFTFSSEGTLAQTEPGSGSTIMGYAGITGNTDVQPHSDDLFSGGSIAQISNSYKTATQGGKCAVVVNTGNKVPLVDAGADYTIPRKTPFALIGKGGDSNKTDILSFIWEQTDVMESPGFSTIPKGNNTKGPMFRTYNYTSSTTRYFPQLSDILLGKDSTKFEVLANVTRDLNFRFTARDNHPGGGNNKSDDVLIKVDGTSGPFKIAYPNTAITKKVGDTLKVSWNVANTNLAPVNCQNVRIAFSMDGGQTFTQFLAKSVPNSGSAIVKVPNKITTQARIAVVAAGNVFFDVSNANFIIKAATAASGNTVARVSPKNTDLVSVSPNPASDYIKLAFGKNVSAITVTLVNATGKSVYTNKFGVINAGNIINIPVQSLPRGMYYIKINTDNDVVTEKVILGNQ